ncbi:MAG: hypothetical protein IMZ71_03150 [Chloroflexi bacterium]|nr:hypothetical protein [Chloroflexota bacterium]
MRAWITNYESSRNIPTRIGDVFFSAGETKIFNGAETINELSAYPGIGVAPIKEKRPRPKALYAGFKINELRAIAKKKGIPGGHRMTKGLLVKMLQEA